MKININHPAFVSLMDKITGYILLSVNIENYFSTSLESRLTTSYTVFNLLRTMPSMKALSTDNELKEFITILIKRNEGNENYEFASVLDNILVNFDMINEFNSSKSKLSKRSKKTDNKDQG